MSWLVVSHVTAVVAYRPVTAAPRTNRANVVVVSANFALVQPSIEVDGPKIFKAIAEVLGEKDVPKIADFQPQTRGAGAPMKRDADPQHPEIRAMLSPVIQKSATEANTRKRGPRRATRGRKDSGNDSSWGEAGGYGTRAGLNRPAQAAPLISAPPFPRNLCMDNFSANFPALSRPSHFRRWRACAIPGV